MISPRASWRSPSGGFGASTLHFLKVVLLSAGISMFTSTCVRVELPAGHTPLLGTDPLDSFKLDGRQQQLAHVRTIDVTGQPFTRALQVTTTTAPDSEGSAQ